MTCNDFAAFRAFAKEQMQKQGDTIRRWARQSENPLLKSLAIEVLKEVEAAENKINSGNGAC